VGDVLHALSADGDADGLQETPRRVAQARAPTTSCTRAERRST